MKTNKISERGGTPIRARGHTPLPQRWRRAKRWADAHHLGSPNTLFLKEMLEQELRGKG